MDSDDEISGPKPGYDSDDEISGPKPGHKRSLPQQDDAVTRRPRRHGISVSLSLEALKETVKAMQPVPSHPLQLYVQGGQGSFSRVDLDNRHVILCSLVASLEACESTDPEIRTLFEWNDHLTRLSESTNVAFVSLLGRLDGIVHTLADAQDERTRAETEAALRVVDCASIKVPDVPLLQHPMREGLRRLTTTPDNHGDALHCYSSNYWLLRFWNASCSMGSVDMQKAVASKARVVVNGLLRQIQSHGRQQPITARPTNHAVDIPDARALYCLFEKQVGLDSEAFSEHRAKALAESENLHSEILALDLDVIAHVKFEKERRAKLRRELVKSAATRAQNERKRLRVGRNEDVDCEFELREDIKRVLDERHPLRSEGVSELMRRRKQAIEASAAEAEDPLLEEEIRACARGERVLQEEGLLEALALTAPEDERIVEMVVKRRQSKARAEFLRMRSEQICRVWPRNVPGCDFVRDAFERQPQMSSDDMAKFTILTLATRSSTDLHDGLQSASTAADALDYLDRHDQKGLAAAARAVGGIVLDMPAPEPVCDLAKRACRTRAPGEHPDVDVRALKYCLMEGFDCPFQERREFFYLWRDNQLYQHNGTWMQRGGMDCKLTETKLARAAARRSSEDKALRAVSLNPAIEEEFLARTHKTDKDFWDPQIVKEDMYLGERDFDAAVKASMRTEATSREAYFTMLDDDCSVPWKPGSVFWTPGKGFCITTEHFSSICSAKVDAKRTAAARRTRCIWRYWTLVAFANPSAAREFLFDPAKDPQALKMRLCGRRHPSGDDPSKLYEELRAMVYSRIGNIPSVSSGFRYDPARFQDYRQSMKNLIATMPERMAQWVRVAVAESSCDATRLSFLVDIDVLLARRGVRQESWINYDFRAVLPLDELCLLARWAQAFLSTGKSKLHEKLGRKPGNDEETLGAIESAIRPVPSEFSWPALAEGTEISPRRVKDLVRWATKEDACGKSDPWKFTASSPHTNATRDVSALRFGEGD